MGQVCVDYVGRVPDYPSEDSKMELDGLFTSCGGPAATAMAALSRWGVPTSLLSCISDDSFGLLITETLEKEGVDSSCLKTVPGYASQFAFIAVTAEDGNRTIFWNRSTVPSLTPEEVRLGIFPNARILHLDGLMLPAAKAAAAQARASGVTVVMDAGTLREGTLDLVSLVDVLIASETFADPILGEKAPKEQALQRLSELGPRQVVITLGRSRQHWTSQRGSGSATGLFRRSERYHRCRGRLSRWIYLWIAQRLEHGGLHGLCIGIGST